MEAYFSPSDSVAAFISNLILTKPTQSLFFCMLKFELPVVENALLNIHTNGKLLLGVFDSANSILANSAYPRLKGLAVPNAWSPPADVFIDTLSGLIHHKYLIIDALSPSGNQITSTGSFNWETPANLGNDENSLTIFDARVNNLYLQEFSQRYKESSGGSIITLVDSEPAPTGALLFQNYPNPFTHVTTLSLSITNPGYVKVILYDFHGNEVQTLVNQSLNAGTHSIQFDGSFLKSGMYFCKLITGTSSQTVKMIVVE
jgi:hypothetical protein